MATRSTAELNRMADAWEDDLDYPSAVLSGIVGDRAHRARGGYHISIEDNPRGNYSIVRRDDAAPPGNWPRDRASAVDMSMSKKDMVKCYKRVHAVWSNPKDPRRKYINAVNCWDGSGDAVRLDFVTGNASYATPDHKWHNHHERRRRYVNDPEATRAELSMYRGESVAQYQRSSAVGDTSVPVPSGSPLLRRGSSGPDVRQLQDAINEVIRAGLVTDGRFGPATERALKAFQRANGLTVDGIYGELTASSLREELSMPSAKEIAKAVREELAAEVKESHWAARQGLHPAGRKVTVEAAGRNSWAYGKANYRKLDQVLSEQAAVRAEQKAQRELLADLARNAGMSDEQVAQLGERIAAAGTGAADEVLARLAAAGEAWVDGEDDE